MSFAASLSDCEAWRINEQRPLQRRIGRTRTLSQASGSGDGRTRQSKLDFIAVSRETLGCSVSLTISLASSSRVQRGCADPIGALLVFLYLLERHAQASPRSVWLMASIKRRMGAAEQGLTSGPVHAGSDHPSSAPGLGLEESVGSPRF